MSTEQTASLPVRKRPLSIWLLCIANGLLAIMLIGTSLTAERFGYTLGQAIFAGVIGLGISISAHLTWYGKRYGRNVLLALLTAFFGLLLAQSAMTIAWAIEVDYEGLYLTRAIAWGVFSVVWLAVNYWFLFGRRARAFYA